MANYTRPILPYGNDFNLSIAMQICDDEGKYVDLDLTQVQDLTVHLICSKHNTDIELDYVIDEEQTNILICSVDYRLLHPNASYGVYVEGYLNDKHIRWEMAAREGILVVSNTSGMVIPETVQVIDLAGRVGFGTNTWSVGPTGAQGPQGEKGDKGDKGDKGEKGDKGDKGDTGATGVQGPQGIQGPTGVQGPQGIQGPTGAQGPQGETGQTGAQGPQGEIGPTGAQGPQGEIGPTGAQGPQGETGPAGTTDYNELENKPDLSVYATQSDLETKQDVLISGVNIKTINEQSILGTGNITIQGGGDNDEANEVTANALYDLNERLSEAEFNIELIPPQLADLQADVDSSLGEMNTTINEQFIEIDDEFKSAALVIENLNTNKQDTLVSGVNIKTINSESIIGTGNIVIQGGTQVNSDWNATTGVEMILNKPTIPNTNAFLMDYSKTYLTFEAIESGTFTFAKSLQYSLDGGNTWSSLDANTATPTITAGDKIMWKQTGLTPNYSGIGNFSSTGNYKAYGNIMSLYYGDNFEGQISLSGKNNAFYSLFYQNTKLIDASNLILPATTLSEACYRQMFYGCSSLKNCPELPATTLANYCYSGMFQNCSLLENAPELPATTLVNNCYQLMFFFCNKIDYIKCLATNISASDCVDRWLGYVSPTGMFIKADNISSWTTGNSGIPTNWITYGQSEYEYPHRYEIPSPTGIVYSSINGLKIEVVSALPQNPDSNCIYIIN